MNDLGTRDIIIGAAACLIFGLGIWFGGIIATERADQHTQTAIANAVAAAPKSPLNCKDSELVEAIKKLAENGAHIKGYKIKLELDNKVDPWN